MSQASRNQTGRNALWYEADEGEAHTALFSVVDYLRDAQSWVTNAHDYHAAMYGGARAAAPDPEPGTIYEYEPSHLARNVTRSAVDTYTAKIFKHRPLPEVLASRGSWRDMRRARKMTQLVEGEFDRHKIFKKWNRIIGRDSGIFGPGLLKIDLEKTDSKTIRCSRLKAKEVFVDPADAEAGDPRNMYYVTSADEGVLVKSFAPDDDKLADKIRSAGIDDRKVLGSRIRTVNRVTIAESWHLCDDDEAHEEDKKHECTGRHAVAVRGADLVDEVWPFNRFPIAQLPYSEPVEGYFATGICEQLEGYQHEQNLMSEKVSASHYYVGGAMIFLNSQGDLVEEDITNGNVRIYRTPPGSEPKVVTPEAVAPGTYQYLRDLSSDAIGEIGLSSMSTMSQKPSGDPSGVALNTLDDIETERFAMQGYAYESWVLDVAELFLMWISHICKAHGDYTSKVPLKGGILELSWKDVSVDHYTLRIYNAALMRLQPSARRATAKALFDTGQIDGQAFMRLLGGGSADIEGEIDTETADRLLVDDQIEAILDAENPEDVGDIIPTPYDTNLEWAMRRAQLRLAQAKTNGCPEEIQDVLLDYILECERLIAKKNGQPPPGGQPPGAPPIDPGAMPPPVPGALPPPVPAPPGPGAPPVLQ